MAARPAQPIATHTPPSFSFFLQPEFPLNALVLASEALRIANQNRETALFTWCFGSQTGEPVRASNGMWFPVDADIKSLPRSDYLLVFEGNLPTQRISPALLNRLRTAFRQGATVGAVDTGAFAMAQAGLLVDRDVVLHWEAASAFAERYPGLPTHNQLYLIDGTLIHCAGGVATLDLMLDLIGRHYDQALASEVANALVHTPRPAATRQRLDEPVTSQAGLLSDRIVRLMEGSLDFPLTLEDVASQLGVSSRTISRSCAQHFSVPPMQLYLRIRLQAARNLLFYEDFPIKDVAIACGFSYPSVFARAFKAQFGQTPSKFRAALRRRQSQTLRPEIRHLTLGGDGNRRRNVPGARAS